MAGVVTLADHLELLNHLSSSLEDKFEEMASENQHLREQLGLAPKTSGARTLRNTAASPGDAFPSKVPPPDTFLVPNVPLQDCKVISMSVQGDVEEMTDTTAWADQRATFTRDSDVQPADAVQQLGATKGSVSTKGSFFTSSGIESTSLELNRSTMFRVKSSVKQRIETRPRGGVAIKSDRAQNLGHVQADPTYGESGGTRQRPHKVFADKDSMKESVRQAILKPEYKVENFYKTTGIWQAIARSAWFNNGTLFCIACNAVWISVEMDNNKATVLNDAEPIFQVIEQFFCFYFSLELAIRFSAFDRKRNCLKDAWFTFDSVLVAAMVAETWAFSIVVALNVGNTSGDLGNASVMRMARLFRLARAARIARLLRSAPELLVLVKGIMVGTRAVFFTLCLLVIFIYLFAIVFTQLAKETSLEAKYFSSVPAAMYSLLCGGILADQAEFLGTLGVEHLFFGALFLLYFLLAALTIMNMLLGVLVDVINVVSAVEKDKANMLAMKHSLKNLLSVGGNEDTFMIDQQGFMDLVTNPQTAIALHAVGVDAIGLIDCCEFVFRNNSKLSFPDLLDLMFNMRGENPATVKDIVEVRKMLMNELAVLQNAVGKRGCNKFNASTAKSLGWV